MSPNFWRQWHRWIALPATLVVLFVAVTGVLVAGTEFFGAEEALREATRDLVSPVKLGAPFTDWSGQLDAARRGQTPSERGQTPSAAAAQVPGAPVDKITMQFKGETPTITIFTGKPTGGEDRRLVVEAKTGRVTEITSYADKPLIHRVHSGEAFGDGGLVAAMIWGAALAFLSLSGFLVYSQMWRRTRTGIRRFFW